MLRVLDFQPMVLQQPLPWENCILYGSLPACTLKSTNTLLGELCSLQYSIDWFWFEKSNLHDSYRSDVVEIETWCQAEGRAGTRRDFIIKDYTTNQVIGRATRYTYSWYMFVVVVIIRWSILVFLLGHILKYPKW